MKAIIKQEDAVIAVDYADLMSFIADNYEDHDGEPSQETWDYAEKLTNGIMCEEPIRFLDVNRLKSSDLYEKRGFADEKEWLLKFFEAHPFITKMLVYFND